VINRAVTPQPTSANPRLFRNVTLSAATLKVPAESVDLYEAATVWMDFGTIEAIVEEGTPCDNPIAEGTAGTLAWMLCPDGTLTITGSGAMPDYEYGEAPWYAHLEAITGIVLGNGVTTIGNNAFYESTSLTAVTIPNSVTAIGDGSFAFCSSLTEVTIGNAVTTIGDNAFQRCSSLTEITIPNSVTAIGNNAFYFCIALAEITVGNAVTSIAGNAFSYCNALASITVADANPNYSSEAGVLFDKGKTTLLQYPSSKAEIAYTVPNTVTAIGNNAFQRCKFLTEVTIGNSVATIGDNAFANNPALAEIAIGNAVTAIGNIAFANCPALTAITVAADNPSYSGEAGVLFDKNKTKLMQYPASKPETVYTVPNTVTAIGNYAFANSRFLTEATIGNSLTAIGDWAFSGSTALTAVTIPNSVTAVGNSAFFNCTSLAAVTIGNSLTAIAVQTFASCTSLTEVTIGSSVTTIGNGAFGGCTGLTAVTNRAETPQVIETFVFSIVELSAITLYVPIESVELYEAAAVWTDFGTIEAIDPCANPIAEGTAGNLEWKICEDGTLNITGNGDMPDYTFGGSPWFSNREAVNTIVIGDGVTRIGNDAFSFFSSLTSVTIGNSVTAIGKYVFNNCSGLTSITLPASVTSIESSVFWGCANLTAINVNNGSQTYSSENGILFSKDKTRLVTCPEGKTGVYAVPASVTKIGDFAFYSCEGLTSVTMPNSVTEIGINTFFSCEGLTAVTLSNQIAIIPEGAFYKCTGLASVTIPNTVTQINKMAFQQSGLTSVTIPNAVTSIDEYAFNGCDNLASITIGSSVTTIVDDAFSSLPALVEVVNYAVTPQQLGEYVFYEVNQAACTLKVPEGSVELYRAATVWKDFGTIEGMEVSIDNRTLTHIAVYGSGNSVYIVNPNNIVLKSVQMVDVLGRVVYDGNVNGSITIPVNGASGIYVVRLLSDDNRVLSTKVRLN
jgi:uncharacterized protein YbaA (DUF1428 family)